jgi:hypothetical protein
MSCANSLLGNVNRCFVGTYRLHLQGHKPRKEAASRAFLVLSPDDGWTICSSETSADTARLALSLVHGRSWIRVLAGAPAILHDMLRASSQSLQASGDSIHILGHATTILTLLAP